jgi:iron complex outermembrane recepter protein
MVRKIIIPVWVCLFIYSIQAVAAPENILKGVITDNNGNTVMGAVISIPDLKTGTTSTADGIYQLAHLPKGTFLVEVRLLGYGTQNKQISIDGVTQKDFVLSTTLIERNELVVTGTSLATEERKAVIPIQSIRVKELRENASTNIIDALTKMPGINQLSTGPAVSKPVIRGLGYNRIVTLHDGTRQEGQQWGDEHGIEIDDYNVSRIEILKGPASLAYGSDALAGVINIISDEPLPTGRVQGNITTNFQTNAGLLAGHASLGGNNKGINWHIYGTDKQAHDYKNSNDGFVHNTRFKNVDYGASIGINKKWGYSRLSYSSFNQQLGIAEGERDSATGRFMKLVAVDGEEAEELATSDDDKSYKMQLPYQSIHHRKLVLNNNFNLNNGGRIGLILGYQQNERQEYEEVLNEETPGLNLLLQTYTYDAKYFFPVANGWSVTTGVNGMLQHNKNKGDEYLIPDYSLLDAGAYLIAKKDWNDWSVSGGMRINHRNIEGTALFVDADGEQSDESDPSATVTFAAFDRSYSNAVGSLGASYTVNRSMTIKLNVASGFRAPNIAELSANGVHEGTIRYEYGNAGLKAEKSLQADLGLAWNSEHVLVNGAVFYNYISNFIYTQKLQSVNGNDSIPSMLNEEGYPAFAFTQGNAGLYGGELYIDFHPHPFDWLHLENTFSYVRGILYDGKDSTASLPYIPAMRWLPELRAQTKTIGKRIKNAYIKAGLDINFMQDKVFSAYNTETATSAYTIVNAGLGFDVVNKKDKILLTITVSAQNITDIAYQNHLSRLKYAPLNMATGNSGIFNMGRNIGFALNVPLLLK